MLQCQTIEVRKGPLTCQTSTVATANDSSSRAKNFSSKDFKMTNATDTQTWPDLAIALYDKLTGRNAEISYSFDDFKLKIPSSTSADAKHASWKMSGTVRITTRNDQKSNA